MLATASPSDSATVCTAFSAVSSPLAAARRTSSTSPSATGQPQQGRVADEHLDAPLGTAMAQRPGRIEDGVAHLAGEPTGALQRPPVDEDAGADAHPPEQVDDVVVAAGTAAAVLGEHGQVGVVPDRHRQFRDGLLHELAERGVVPAEVGSQPDHVRQPLHRSRNADADTHRAHAAAHRLLERRHRIGDLPGELLGRDGAGRHGEHLPGQHPAADPDGRGDDAVHVDVDGHHERAVGPRPDDVRRPPDPRATARNRLTAAARASTARRPDHRSSSG